MTETQMSSQVASSRTKPAAKVFHESPQTTMLEQIHSTHEQEVVNQTAVSEEITTPKQVRKPQIQTQPDPQCVSVRSEHEQHQVVKLRDPSQGLFNDKRLHRDPLAFLKTERF